MKALHSILTILLTAAAVCIPATANAKKPVRPAFGAQTAQQPSMSDNVKNLLERARKGDAAAQNELGICYLTGKGVKSNDTLAYKWFTKAAAQKMPKAIINMAYCLRHGKGVTADSIKARDLYINAIGQGKDSVLNIIDNASQKDIFMARTLAYAYANGKSVKRNPAAVKSYLKRAVDLGDKSALYPYAQYCFRTRDHVSAQKAYEKAYRNGEEKAGYWYGRYLINGEGGNPNPAEGFRIIYPYATRGNTGAQELAGLCLLNGNGTQANPKEAVEWFTKAARKGSPESIWQLALCNATGTGTDRNMLMAFYLMNREAMHSSENKFKEWLNPAGNTTVSAKTYPEYLLYLQGLKAINDSNINIAMKVAKELGKQKLEKDSKVLEGLALLSQTNPKRNVKKGFKLLSPYLDSDPLLLFVIDNMQLNGALEGLDNKYLRNIPTDLGRLGTGGFGEAYSLLGDLYLNGKEGLTASDQRALTYWLKAMDLDGLSFASANTLAKCYDEGLGGLKPDKDKARSLRNKHRADQLQTLFELIPAYSK